MGPSDPMVPSDPIWVVPSDPPTRLKRCGCFFFWIEVVFFWGGGDVKPRLGFGMPQTDELFVGKFFQLSGNTVCVCFFWLLLFGYSLFLAEKNSTQLYHNFTRWWFQIWLCSFPYLGKNDPSWLAHIFQMGWFNHQLDLPRMPATRVDPRCGSHENLGDPPPATEIRPCDQGFWKPLVSLNKALLNPYFWECRFGG